MSNIIESRYRKARKVHICDYCGVMISKGEEYHYSKYIWEDKVYGWKSHKECEYIVAALWDYIDPDEGVTEDDFRDALHKFCRNFVCPDCENWDTEFKDCELDEIYCIDRTYEFLQKNELYLAERSMFGGIWKCRRRQ